MNSTPRSETVSRRRSGINGRRELQHLNWKFLAIQSLDPARAERDRAHQNAQPSLGQLAADAVETELSNFNELDAVARTLTSRLQFHKPDSRSGEQERFSVEDIAKEMQPTRFSFSALHQAGRSLREGMNRGPPGSNGRSSDQQQQLQQQQQQPQQATDSKSDPLDSLAPNLPIFNQLQFQPSAPVGVQHGPVGSAGSSSAAAIRKPKPITYSSILASLVQDGDDLLRRSLRSQESSTADSPALPTGTPLSSENSAAPSGIELTDEQRKKRIQDVYQERQRRRRKRLSRIGAIDLEIPPGGPLQEVASTGRKSSARRSHQCAKDEEDEQEEDLVTYLQKTWLAAMRVENAIPLVGGSDTGVHSHESQGRSKADRSTDAGNGDNDDDDDDDEFDRREMRKRVDDLVSELDNAIEANLRKPQSSPAGEKTNKRPPSPVVLWKASSRVQLATHIPSALRTLLLQNAAVQHMKQHQQPHQPGSKSEHSPTENKQQPQTPSSNGSTEALGETIDPPRFSDVIGRDPQTPGRASSTKPTLGSPVPQLQLPPGSSSTQQNDTARSKRDTSRHKAQKLSDFSILPSARANDNDEERRLTARRRAEARNYGAWYISPELWTARSAARQTLEQLEAPLNSLSGRLADGAVASETMTSRKTSTMSSTGSMQKREVRKTSPTPLSSSIALPKASNRTNDEHDAALLTLLGSAAGDSEALEEVLCRLAARELTLHTKRHSSQVRSLSPMTPSSFDILAQAHGKAKWSAEDRKLVLPVEAERALAMKLRELHPRTQSRFRSKPREAEAEAEGTSSQDSINPDSTDAAATMAAAAARDAEAQRKLGETIRSLPIAKEFVSFLLSGGGEGESPTGQKRSVCLPAYLRGVVVDDHASPQKPLDD